MAEAVSFGGLSDDELNDYIQATRSYGEILDNLMFAYHNFEYLPPQQAKAALGVAISILHSGIMSAEMKMELEVLLRTMNAKGDES